MGYLIDGSERWPCSLRQLFLDLFNHLVLFIRMLGPVPAKENHLPLVRTMTHTAYIIQNNVDRVCCGLSVCVCNVF